MIVVQPSVNKDSIMRNLEKVMESRWLGMGPMTKLFEEKLAEYWDVDPDSVVCVNSGTSALQLAFWLYNKYKPHVTHGIVATTPITFVSTNHAILYNGLAPVFYDVNPRTGLVNAESLLTLSMRRKIDVIVVVHVAGQPADMSKIVDIANYSHAVIIEDCAHAMGSRYPDGKRVGNNNNLSCFSFHAVKNLAIGDGGAIVLGGKWKKHSKLLRQVRWMGIDKDTFSRSGKTYSWDYDVSNLGFKAHMNDISAAIGLAQLEDLDSQNAVRRGFAQQYNEGLPSECLAAYGNSDGCNYHLYLSFFENRNAVADVLRENGISPGMHYKRNDKYRMYRDFLKQGTLEGAQWYEDHELSLPMHPNLTPEDVDRVIMVVKEIV